MQAYDDGWHPFTTIERATALSVRVPGRMSSFTTARPLLATLQGG